MEPSKNNASCWSNSVPAIRAVPDPLLTSNADDDLCNEMVLVMSYVKRQQWDQVYEPETALDRGTIFPELDLPFMGEGACRCE